MSGKDIYDNEYTSRFLKGGVNVFDESVNWFVENGAITAEDKIEIIKLKSHRNEIAHDMMEFLAEPDKEIKDNLLISCYKILSKIDKWWILQVEIPTNPDSKEDPSMGIVGMSMVVLQLLHKVYTGDDQGLEEIYNKFIKNYI